MRRRKTVDAELIMSLKTCPEWTEKRIRAAVPKRISVITALRDENIPIDDRIWVILHNEFLDNRTMRLFACECAERALNRKKAVGFDIDERSWHAIAVSRRYANGQATDEELKAARDASLVAAWSCASYAASNAARDAARDAARYAALSAASEAALYAASKAARSAAMDAERSWQIDRIIEIIKENKGEKT